MWAWTLLGCPYRSELYDEFSAAEICVADAAFEDGLDPWVGVTPTPPVDFEVNDEATVYVFFHHALSECDEVFQKTCRIAFDGNDAFIESTAEVRFHKDRTDCDGPITPAYASCETPPLDEGSWTFHYDELKFQVEVPGTLSIPCEPVDEPGCSHTGGSGMGLGFAGLMLALARRQRRSPGSSST